MSGLRHELRYQADKAWRSAPCGVIISLFEVRLQFIVRQQHLRVVDGPWEWVVQSMLWLKWEGLCQHRERSVLSPSLCFSHFHSQFSAVVYFMQCNRTVSRTADPKRRRQRNTGEPVDGNHDRWFDEDHLKMWRLHPLNSAVKTIINTHFGLKGFHSAPRDPTENIGSIKAQLDYDYYSMTRT